MLWDWRFGLAWISGFAIAGRPDAPATTPLRAGPLLPILTNIAGLVFGREAVRGSFGATCWSFWEDTGRKAIEAMLAGASSRQSGGLASLPRRRASLLRWVAWCNSRTPCMPSAPGRAHTRRPLVVVCPNLPRLLGRHAGRCCRLAIALLIRAAAAAVSSWSASTAVVGEAIDPCYFTGDATSLTILTALFVRLCKCCGRRDACGATPRRHLCHRCPVQGS